MNFKIEQIDDYRSRLTPEQKVLVIEHCNKYNIKPTICAWYDDEDDFYDVWMDELGYEQSTSEYILNGEMDNQGEFITFEDGQIIRFDSY